MDRQDPDNEGEDVLSDADETSRPKISSEVVKWIRTKLPVDPTRRN